MPMHYYYVINGFAINAKTKLLSNIYVDPRPGKFSSRSISISQKKQTTVPSSVSISHSISSTVIQVLACVVLVVKWLLKLIM